MAGIILPNRFTQQPQYPAPLDLQGLAKGAQLCINPAVGPTDLVTKRVWAPNGNFGIVATPAGRTLNFDGSASFLSYTGYPEISGSVGTFALWFPRVGAASTFGSVFFGDSSVYFQVDNSGKINAWGANASSGTISWFNTTNRSLVFVSQDGTASGIKVYLDGKDTGFTFPSNAGSFSSSSKSLTLGRYVGGSSWDVNASLASPVYLSRPWGAPEVKAFHESRGNALYKVPQRRIWVGVVAAGGTTYLQSLAGSITGAGTVAKQTGKQLAGTSTATGAIAKQTSKSLSGSSTATGSLSRLIGKYPAGSIIPVGNPAKQTTKSFAGSITGTGAVATMILFTKAVAGSITMTGAIAKMTLKALTGASTFSGTISKMTNKGLSASITLSGVVNKFTTKAFAGTMTVTGTLTENYQVMKSLAGSIKPTGTVTAVYIAFVAGVLKMLSLLGVGQ